MTPFSFHRVRAACVYQSRNPPSCGGIQGVKLMPRNRVLRLTCTFTPNFCGINATLWAKLIMGRMDANDTLRRQSLGQHVLADRNLLNLMMNIYLVIMTSLDLWETTIDGRKLASLAIIYQTSDNTNNYRENGSTDCLYDVCMR